MVSCVWFIKQEVSVIRNSIQQSDKMSTCHATCLTCSSSAFNACLSCSTGLTLSSSICHCQSPWQSQCTGQYSFREVSQFATLFIELYIVGVMLLYILKARLPLSYRCWSGLNGLSLLIYSTAFYIQYEDEFCLKALALSNGPYFATYRIMSLSTSHIFPTMSLIIIMAALLILLYFPFSVFVKQRDSIFEYLRTEGLHMFDCTYFFAAKMIFFYLGKFIVEASTASVTYIVVAGAYGLFVLVAWMRTIYKYHEGTISNSTYESPIYLYTILGPATMLGLPFASSQVILTVVYCAPFGLLFLILLLNRNMRIFTRPNVKFFIVEAVMVGVTICFIFLNDEIKTYVLMVAILGSAAGITIECWLVYNSGFEVGSTKVYPELENDEPGVQKKIYGEEKDGYF